MNLLQEFFNPDKQYSVQAFWFLNGQLEPEKLKEQMKEMTEKGVYGGFLHPRAYLKTAYLEQPWWDAIDACVEAAKEYGFSPWLYDEYAWPSGTAGSTFAYGYQKPSRVLAEGEKNMAKGLYARKFTEKQNWQEFASNPKDYVYHVAEKNGIYYVFYHHVFETAVDYMNPETIALFIRLTHEEYSKRYQDTFGTLIPGIFFDEIFMTGNPIPWTKKLPDRFLETYGYELKDKLPSLVDGETEEDKQVRKDYFELIAAMYEEAFFKQISDWCRDHGLKLIGHTEESIEGFPRRQGNYFDTMRHLMIPGADCHDYRYTYPRKITCSEPKHAVSVARAYGKERAMSEALGGAGWNIRMEDLKRGINVLAAMGINMFILHGFYYECEHQGSQSDWPTSFFYQNPYWKNFKRFADYIRRISFMNSAGTPVVQYGILYPASDMQENMINGEENAKGKSISSAFHQTFLEMLEHQMDTDMIDERSILQAEILDGKLCVGVQKFQLLLLPKGGSIKEETKEKLISWNAQGGNVVFYETGVRQDNEFLKDSLVCCPQNAVEVVRQLVPPNAKIVSGNWQDIYINHRRIEGKDCYLVVNGTEEKREILLSFMESGVPMLLDLETGTAEAAVCEEMLKSCLVSLTLKEDQAVYLMFGMEQEGKTDATWQNRKMRYPAEEITTVTGKWDFLPLEKEDKGNEAVKADTSRMEVVLADFSTDLHEDTWKIRICNQVGKEGRCGRHFSLWHGSWITRRPSWNDQLSASDLYFRKTIYAEGKPKQLTMCLAAIDWVEVFLNGKQIYAGESNGTPVELTNSSALKEGDNLLAVHVRNHHPLADVYVCSVEELPKDRLISLLLEGWLETEKDRQLICSDSSWLVSDIEEEGWKELEDSKIRKNEHFDVQRVRKFYTEHAGHQWILAWERGKPPILPWGELPLFGKLTDYPRKLYYNLKIPAGTVRIKKPAVQGRAVYRLNGKPIVWLEDWLSIPKSASVQHLTIEAEAKSPEDGLKRPLEIVMEEYKVNLGDWREGGLEDFSGRGRYRTFWTLKKQEGKRYVLSLGQVCHGAEIYINQKLADIRLWKPYEADVTEYLTDGENEIMIIIANLASNERRYMLVDEGMALGWNRYWNEDNMDRDSQNYVSGLLGPVRLIARENK